MRPRTVFGLIFLIVLAARLCHLDVLWIEECYPAAGALQVLAGKLPYRDFWFDKPPLAIGLHLLWGAHAGWPLRLGDALFVTLISWLLYRFARERWSEREGLLAAALGAFFLTFGFPSAVMSLAPDLIMMAPHIAAVYLAWKGRPFASGLAAGVAMLVHTKGVYVLAACLLWQYRAIPALAAGFLVPNVLFAGWLAATGSLAAYWEQVWRFGQVYVKDTFAKGPFSELGWRTQDWLLFHACLVAGMIWFWIRARDRDRLQLAGWTLLAILGIAAGWRFFPRYYLQLLPIAVLLAARGLTLLGPKRATAVLALLLIPLVRFGPRYATLAWESATGRPHQWADLAMYDGSVEVADRLDRLAAPGDSLLVWGYRPDIYVLTRLPAGTAFLDSQPLTGVIADRHLVDSRPSVPELARQNRQELTRTSPTWIVDGLGPYNPVLGIGQYPDLAAWLANYRQAFTSPSAVVYRRITGRIGAAATTPP